MSNSINFVNPFFWLTQLRRALYSRSVFKSEKLDIPVISIGNLSFGGTGKTPFLLWLAQELEKKYDNIGIISKSYKASCKNPGLIFQEDSKGPSYWGDEPYFLSKKLKNIKVFAGPHKVKTALWALQNYPQLQCLLIDDGFQHLQLKSDLHIVLLDMSDTSMLRVFPFGRGREGVEALSAANKILLTKCPETFRKEDYPFLKEWEMQHPKSLFEAQFTPQWPSLALKDQKWIVFSGLANNSAFFNQVQSTYGDRIWETLSFSDHEPYTLKTQKEIEIVLKEAPSGCRLMTTEKDAIKLKMSTLGPLIDVIPLTVEVARSEELLCQIKSFIDQ